MKIKLRDLTTEQYKKWNRNNMCEACDDCIFRNVYCSSDDCECWVYHKDMFSDKFLDQEIEIEDEPLIDKQTQDYLEKINKDYEVTHVHKGSDYIRFFADIDGEWEINFYCSKKAKIYNDFRNLETGKYYLIKDLIQSKNDILTLEERQYLRAVIKPFRSRVKTITKTYLECFNEFEWLVLEMIEDGNDASNFPFFEKGTMYKGMEANKKYTLEELGL